jgi:hypothetical protein
MRVFLWCVFGFCLGLVIGYATIFYGWTAYSEHFHVVDGDGSKIIRVEFEWAPVGAAVMGLILAFRLALRAARRATGLK